MEPKFFQPKFFIGKSTETSNFFPKCTIDACEDAPDDCQIPPHWTPTSKKVGNLIAKKRVHCPLYPSKTGLPLLVYLAEMEELCNSDIYEHIPNIPGRAISGIIDTREGNGSFRIAQEIPASRQTEYPAAPMITIGLEQIMTKAPNTKGKKYLSAKHFALDKRFTFWDSSIWHRYIALTEGWEKKLDHLLDEIALNYQRGLYYSIVAHEYLELQVRLLRQNYFQQLPSEDGHGKGVLPFTYWSETDMKRNADSLREKILSLQPTLRWNCYLVDDYAHKQLRPIEFKGIEKMDKGLFPTKGQLILALANLSPRKEAGHKMLGIANVEQGQEKRWRIRDLVEDITDIKDPKVYDIIFLDYFLGEARDHDGGNGFSYGHEFLEKVLRSKRGEPKNEQEKNLAKFANPFGKYWILPISAFPFAFKTHINARGDENFTEFWNLSDGGDPINCPHHFRMKLYKLLLSQLEAASIDEEDLIDMLQLILEEKDPFSRKQKARENYNYFTQLLANFYRVSVKHDPYGKGFMQRRDIHKDALLLTHLEQFIRLLAFAPSQDVFKVDEKLGVLLRVSALQNRKALVTVLMKYGKRQNI